MRRSFAAALVGLAIAPAAATPAAAQAPLVFQGGDGDQVGTVDAAGRPLDWQGLAQLDQENPSVLLHELDVNAPNDLQFEPGNTARENVPRTWRIATDSGPGVSPDLANIRDTWGSVEQVGTNTFLYLALARGSGGQLGQGGVYYAFELNRDPQRWDNDNNPNTPAIPCRSTGDVLITLQDVGGGSYRVVIYRWTTRAGPADDPDRYLDPDSGCALEGSLGAGVVVSPSATYPAQHAINSGPITNFIGGTFGSSLPDRAFGEVALNLGAVLPGAFPNLGYDCLNFASIWMHSSESANDPDASTLKDFVEPRRLAVRSCAASGTKFFDSNANGRRDRFERGIPRFRIWADYNNDGVWQQGVEPSAISDRRGGYVIYGIRQPYVLREMLVGSSTPISRDWRCSTPNLPPGSDGRPNASSVFPCMSDPIDPAVTPNSSGHAFGNWFPARLRLQKALDPPPPADLGLFNLHGVGRDAVSGAGVFDGLVPNATDGTGETFDVPPGIYDVNETAVAPTDLADYTSFVTCGRRTSPGTEFTGLRLLAGSRRTCTFSNTRNTAPPTPGIVISKTGPAVADAGHTLHYDFLVVNTGGADFAMGDVKVSDPRCDSPPDRVSTHGDDSPDTLNPGDQWTYRCSRSTPRPGADCQPTTVTNTGTVTVPGDNSSSDWETILLCPDSPPPPPPIDHPTDVPGPVAPPGPTPPRAGDPGRARVAFARATRGCLRTHVPRVNLSGTRISRVRIYVNGHLRQGLNLRTLQSRVRPRITLAPGRYRVTARVDFELGSGTPPLTLTRTVEICGQTAAAPNFTG